MGGQLIKVFDAANNADRRIPRLFPASTFSVYGRRRATDRSENDVETEVEAEEPVNGVEPGVPFV